MKPCRNAPFCGNHTVGNFCDGCTAYNVRVSEDHRSIRSCRRCHTRLTDDELSREHNICSECNPVCENCGSPDCEDIMRCESYSFKDRHNYPRCECSYPYDPLDISFDFNCKHCGKYNTRFPFINMTLIQVYMDNITKAICDGEENIFPESENDPMYMQYIIDEMMINKTFFEVFVERLMELEDKVRVIILAEVIKYEDGDVQMQRIRDAMKPT